MLRQGQYLMAGIFDSARFMRAHMASLSRYHALVGLQHGRNHYRIGLGTTHQKFYDCFRALGGFSDLSSCILTIHICPVTRQRLHIRLC